MYTLLLRRRVNRALLLMPASLDMMISIMPPRQDMISDYYQACIVGNISTKARSLSARTGSSWAFSASVDSLERSLILSKLRFGKEIELAKLVFPFKDKMMNSQKKGSSWQLLAQRLVILKTNNFVPRPISNPMHAEGCLAGLWAEMWTKLLSKEKTDRNFRVAMSLTVKALMIKGVSRTSIENAQHALSQQQSKDQELRYSFSTPPRLPRASSAPLVPSVPYSDGLPRKVTGASPLALPSKDSVAPPRSFRLDSQMLAGRSGKTPRNPRPNTGLKLFAPKDSKFPTSLQIQFSSSRPYSLT